MKNFLGIWSISLATITSMILAAPAMEAQARQRLDVAKIYFEYNFTANDLGVHVFLDGEDWKEVEIVNPHRRTIFEVEGNGPYRELGMTELFFEGAEPNLDEIPLEDLLALFPKGRYKFLGWTVHGERIEAAATLSHAIPNGPANVDAVLGTANSLLIGWDPPTGSLTGLPFTIVAYQVIVGAFQVTVPASITSVTVTPEFVQSLAPGKHDVEVLAIEAGGNQTITESSFVKP